MRNILKKNPLQKLNSIMLKTKENKIDFNTGETRKNLKLIKKTLPENRKNKYFHVSKTKTEKKS